MTTPHVIETLRHGAARPRPKTARPRRDPSADTVRGPLIQELTQSD